MISPGKILFPLAVASVAAAGGLGIGSEAVRQSFSVSGEIMEMYASQDTVIYPRDAYKLRRKGTFSAEAVIDSLSGKFAGGSISEEDTIPVIRARDTIKVPDSLRFTDPFRYRYYIALVDSLTHREVRDSLIKSFESFLAAGDSAAARRDSLDWRKLDSLYAADSTIAAKAAFLAWYNSLSKEERKKYDFEQKEARKKVIADSLKAIRDEKNAIRDSIRESTPRILETFAIPDSMQYKRFITWTVDQDFHKIEPFEPDTSFNYYFYDYAFRRRDVNATWLGVAGSPVQTYDFFKRDSWSGSDWFAPNEAWSYSPSTLPMYNSKTPHTELAYWGTLLDADSKESDNLHLMTTQNIFPEWNIGILLERWGGGGMLNHEKGKHSTAAVSTNYLGKRYLMHAGIIHTTISREENGGIKENKWIRDTTVEAREIAVNLTDAASKIGRNTLFLDQQYRIPFTFIDKWMSRRDSTHKTDSLGENITTAFIGHSSEYSRYSRTYTDGISASSFYENFNISEKASADSVSMSVLENKLFVRLQPWASDALVSKLDVGAGDYLKTYYDTFPDKAATHRENSFYIYAGAEGRFRGFDWNAKGRYVLAGHDFGSFGIEAAANLSLYPFRKARKSPLNLRAAFSTSLREPDHYTQLLYTNHFSWNNDFGKISTTKLTGEIDIPYWDLSAGVGYALLANGIYYGTDAVVRQNSPAISIVSANIRKDFTLGGFLHLDNRALFQVSSDSDVLPLPTAALNLRYYAQFVVQKDESKKHNVMEMQVGVNAFFNTAWYAPSYNPALGVFHNQKEVLYNNGPIFDAFVNIQWKRACIFVKLENAGQGWPMDKYDYFTANHYINTPRTVKLGIFWPFYTPPGRNAQATPGRTSAPSGSSKTM